MSKKKVGIIIAAVVVVLVVIYIICVATGNVKPADDENLSSDISSVQNESDVITSLEFGESDNFGFEEIGDEVLSWIKVNTDNYSADDLEIVVVNPDVASIEFTDKSGKNQWYRIVAQKSGRTGFYIQTKDGTVRTETKSIVVNRTQEELEAIPD